MIPNYKIEFLKDKDCWKAIETKTDGKRFYGFGETPEEALANISTENVEEGLSKTFLTVLNNVEAFINKLENGDTCKLSISTEILLKATPKGSLNLKGNEYLALGIEKVNKAEDNTVLLNTMPYPAKKLYKLFDTV